MSKSKGPLPYTGQSMSSKKTGMSGTGKMSSSHGCTNGTKDNNMNRNTGGYRIGKGVKTFGKSNYRQCGYEGGATKHAKQPKGD